MTVRTSDPHHPEFQLKMSGKVLKRKDISSNTARLTGNAGEEIQQTITISPSPENPFTITDIRLENGDDIQTELETIEGSGGIRYELTISNRRAEKGWYVDTVYVKTTSPITPEFKINVLGVIRDDS
jgi:uncharacterized membrane protein